AITWMLFVERRARSSWSDSHVESRRRFSAGGSEGSFSWPAVHDERLVPDRSRGPRLGEGRLQVEVLRVPRRLPEKRTKLPADPALALAGRSEGGEETAGLLRMRGGHEHHAGDVLIVLGC